MGTAKDLSATFESWLPDEVREGLLCLRRRRHWSRAGLIFIHVPKVAGTSVSTAVYGRPLGHVSARSVRRYCPALYAASTVCSLMRNPWDRAVSGYEFAKRGGDVWGARRLRRRARDWESFEDFVLGVLSNADLRRGELAFRTQTSFLSDAEGVIVPDVYRMEDMPAFEAFLRERLGERIEIPRINTSVRQKDFREYYRSRAVIDRVAELYAADITLGGYSF